LMLGEGMKMTALGSQSTIFVEPGVNWFDKPYVFDQVVRCASRIFESLRPPGELEVPENLASDSRSLNIYDMEQTASEGFARTILDEASSGHSKSGSMPRLAKIIHELLGPLASRVSTTLHPPWPLK
jgi:hypothetical protein